MMRPEEPDSLNGIILDTKTTTTTTTSTPPPPLTVSPPVESINTNEIKTDIEIGTDTQTQTQTQTQTEIQIQTETETETEPNKISMDEQQPQQSQQSQQEKIMKEPMIVEEKTIIKEEIEAETEKEREENENNNNHYPNHNHNHNENINNNNNNNNGNNNINNDNNNINNNKEGKREREEEEEEEEEEEVQTIIKGNRMCLIGCKRKRAKESRFGPPKKKRKRWGEKKEVVENGVTAVNSASSSSSSLSFSSASPSSSISSGLSNALNTNIGGPTLKMDSNQSKRFLLKMRLQEVNTKLLNPTAFLKIGPRSPSPEPIYDNKGIRQNTRENRFREKLTKERNEVIGQLIELDPSFQPPSDYKPPKLTKKIFMPVDELPDCNWFGIIVGPRGDNQKQLQKETNCKIAVRGIGATDKTALVVTGLVQEEAMHVELTASNQEALDKGVAAIEKIVNDVREGKHESKNRQLVRVSTFEGMFRDVRCRICGGVGHPIYKCPERSGEAWTPAEVQCQICGEVSHVTEDCKYYKKGKPLQQLINSYRQQGSGVTVDDEYQQFMAELMGDAPLSRGIKGALTGPTTTTIATTSTSIPIATTTPITTTIATTAPMVTIRPPQDISMSNKTIDNRESINHRYSSTTITTGNGTYSSTAPPSSNQQNTATPVITRTLSSIPLPPPPPPPSHSMVPPPAPSSSQYYTYHPTPPVSLMPQNPYICSPSTTYGYMPNMGIPSSNNMMYGMGPGMIGMNGMTMHTYPTYGGMTTTATPPHNIPSSVHAMSHYPLPQPPLEYVPPPPPPPPPGPPPLVHRL